MNKKYTINLFFVIASLAVLLACSFLRPRRQYTVSVPQLPNHGVFLLQENDFVELQQYMGQPTEDSIISELVTAPSDPVFLVWYPQMDQQYFSLVTLDRPGAGIPYTIKPLDEQGQILEIRPGSPLQDGVHCFYQGNPSGDPDSLPFWCFLVGSNTSLPIDKVLLVVE